MKTSHHVELPDDLPDMSPLRDEAYSNDVCPVFRARLGARIAELWIDDADPDARELYGPRFAFNVHTTPDGYELGDLVYSESAETLAELLGGLTVAQYVAKHTQQTRDQLTATYGQFCTLHGLPSMCADELLCFGGVECRDAREWLQTFVQLWDGAQLDGEG